MHFVGVMTMVIWGCMWRITLIGNDSKTMGVRVERDKKIVAS